MTIHGGELVLDGTAIQSEDFAEVGWRDDDLQCSLCGCTDSDCSECWERTGEPCHWASEDPPVCSACAGANGKT